MPSIRPNLIRVRIPRINQEFLLEDFADTFLGSAEPVELHLTAAQLGDFLAASPKTCLDCLNGEHELPGKVEQCSCPCHGGPSAQRGKL